MKTRVLKVVVAVSIVLATTLAYAQRGAANSVEANKKVVYDFYRFGWEPRSLEGFNKYTSPSYIEHNPMFPGPRENIINFLKSGKFGDWTKPAKIEPTLKDPPALIIAEGDLVQWVFKRPTKDPKNPAKMYDSYWYDTFRVKDGKIVEHWDGATLP